MKSFLQKGFVKIVGFLSRGLGLSRFKIVIWIYSFVFTPLKRGGSVIDVDLPTIGKLKFTLDKNDSLGLSVFKIYEEFETNLFIHEIKPGEIVVDAGANIGYYTVIFSKLVGEGGRVYAFEPDPVNFEILKKNVEQNNCRNVILEKKALSNKNEMTKLYLSKENMGDHRIYDSGEGRTSVEVETVRLDDYLKDIVDRICVLKIDVQGAEVMVLEGAREVLNKSLKLKIFSEFWPSAIKKTGKNAKDFFVILDDNNFSFKDINAVKRNLEEIRDMDIFIESHSTEKDGGANVFMEKKQKTNTERIKILFVADLNTYGRSSQRYQVLKNLGHEVVGLSHVPVPWNPRKDFSLIEAISWRLKIPVDLTAVNKKIKNEILKNRFDILWIEKGNTILPLTLKFVKKHSIGTKIVSASEDDMYAKHNHSLYYKLGLKYYDVVFTTKTFNLEELKLLGAKRTELYLDAYNEELHKPCVLSEEEENKYSCNVGFIGAFEEDRAQRMLYLAKNGIKVIVWGLDWGPWVGKHKNLDVKNKPVFGDDYSKVICATKINLCFLRKINRDEATCRTMEIPACGAFMLGERTKRHLDFFEEGKEAEFFGSNEEMLQKVRFYLENDEKRKEIARAGRERCLKSGYSQREQLSQMLMKVSVLK